MQIIFMSQRHHLPTLTTQHQIPQYHESGGDFIFANIEHFREVHFTSQQTKSVYFRSMHKHVLDHSGDSKSLDKNTLHIIISVTTELISLKKKC